MIDHSPIAFLSHDPKKSAIFGIMLQRRASVSAATVATGPHWAFKTSRRYGRVMFEIGSMRVEFAVRQLDPHRIDEMPIHQDLVMEMRPCRSLSGRDNQ